MLSDSRYHLLLLFSRLFITSWRNICKGENRKLFHKGCGVWAPCKSQQGRMPTFWPPCGGFWWALWSTLRRVKCHRWKRQTETASAMMAGRTAQKVAAGFPFLVYFYRKVRLTDKSKVNLLFVVRLNPPIAWSSKFKLSTLRWRQLN